VSLLRQLAIAETVIDHIKMKEINFLFWNTYKNPLIEEILELIHIHNINFLILLENPDNPNLIKALKNYNPDFKRFPSKIFNKAKIFSSIKNIEINEITGHGSYGIYLLTHPLIKEHLITITHFPSKINWSKPGDHLTLCSELKNDIEEEERNYETKHSIVVGDFNMNPFEEGLVNSGGLHNTNNKEIALTISRNIQKRQYNYFYNPMWNFFGDNSRGKVSGTHFYNTYSHTNYFWNIYDQVMIRPDLLESFEENHLDIISEIGEIELLKYVNGYSRVNKDYSDHLPLKFKLNPKTIKENEKSMA